MQKIQVDGHFQVREILLENNLKYDKIVTLINWDRIYKMGPKIIAEYYENRKVLVIKRT